MSPCHILLPVRPPEEGKTRLSGIFDADYRKTLNWRFFRNCLDIACQLVDASRCIVVSRSLAVRDEAERRGAISLQEDGSDLNLALTQAAAFGRDRGASAVLSLSCDLPLLDKNDLDVMLQVSREADVVIAPDRHRKGTNALLVRPPLAIPYLYGASSLGAHLTAARKAGLSASVFYRRGLATDIDLPNDTPLMPVEFLGY
ncbi:2-phospho-L-lactate guanylyltransferase [Sphingobium lactosutens]|uniref:2-phospho-L-lactate guanylyltransferase n=1 Tax=Sphingobium lactosutens TaxID=522773 RepID=UPI0015BE9875|nr:2-phospho-L-lactate guanylyltransferase [Sphingobium lactosutens]